MGRRTLLLLASILVAAVGTALIWIYVQNADARARSQWHQTKLVLRATAPINPGASTLAIQQATEVVPVPVTLVPDDAVSDVHMITGLTPAVPIFVGQLLQKGQFDPIPATAGVAKGKVAVSVSIEDPNRLAGLLHPSMSVDVYFVDPARGAHGSVRMMIQGARVLAVGNTTVVRNAQGKPAQIGTQTGVGAGIVTLEVDPKLASQVIMAATKNGLWFTVPGEGVNLSDSDGTSGDRLPVWNG